MKRIILLIVLFISWDELLAQSVSIGDPFDLYLRVLSVSGVEDSLNQDTNTLSYNFRPSKQNRYKSQLFHHPWNTSEFFNSKDQESEESYYYFYSPKWVSTWNSAYNFGQNDGVLWQGKGLNQELSLGGVFQYSIFQASLRPVFTYSQNLDYDIAPYPISRRFSEFRNMFSSQIDFPQRFGNESLSKFHPGNSYIRLQYSGYSAGFSYENIWAGPALHNPISFSNNAPGFPHFYIGSYSPISTPIGNIEGRLLWGRLEKSEFYNENENNRYRYINAITLSYSPSFIKGLHIGGTRSYLLMYPDEGLQFSDLWYVAIPFTKESFADEDNPSGNDESYQMVSLFGRWAFPNQGFEIYAEWSRNDHAWDWRDFILQPEHARAYVLGFQKRFDTSKGNWMVWNVETTQLEGASSMSHRRATPYYVNNTVRQGYTHKGQILGASIGPGSNSRLMKLSHYSHIGMLGISAQHVVHNNDHLYQYLDRITTNQPENLTIADLQQTEYRFGLHGFFFLPYHLDLEANVYLSNFKNRYYLHNNDVFNTNIQLTLRYNLPGFVR